MRIANHLSVYRSEYKLDARRARIAGGENLAVLRGDSLGLGDGAAQVRRLLGLSRRGRGLIALAVAARADDDQ